jgi:MFS family permease
MMVAIPAFFDLTGMVVISVFSPVLFRTVGFDSQKAIFGAVIISLVSLCGVVLSTLAVDRCGRRFLFLAGGTAMLLFQVCKLFMPVPLLVVMYVRACVL